MRAMADEEGQIIGSFAQTHCFPRAVQYLDSGKIRVKGMVSTAAPGGATVLMASVRAGDGHLYHRGIPEGVG